MRQVIIGGYHDALNASDTEYQIPMGGGAWLPDAADREQIVSTPGRIRRLYVALTAAPGAGTSYTFTLLKNGVAQDLSVTIQETDTTGFDLANSVAVGAGDAICLRVTPSGTPATPYARWSLVFDGTETRESLILGSGLNHLTDTWYVPISHGKGAGSTVEADSYQVIPVAGVIKNLIVAQTVGAGTAPEAYRYTLRKNGASTDLTTTVEGLSLVGTDTEHEVTVAAGDYVGLMIEPLNTPTNSEKVRWGMTFQADTDGYSVILGNRKGYEPSTTDTEYAYLAEGDCLEDWGATESDFYQQAQLGYGAILQKFYIKLSVAPGAGKSYTFKVRQNAADSDVSVLIEDTETEGSASSNTVTLADWDYLDISSTPSGTPAATEVYWGLGCYIPSPTAGVTHDIVLEKADGTRRGFMIVPGSEIKQPVNQFAPVIANVSDPMWAEGVWRSWSMDEWSGGCSDLDWKNRNSFLSSDLVETRHERGLSLASDIESSDAGVNVLEFIDIEGSLGSELVSNPGFESWTGDSPDNWTANNVTTNKASSAVHGGSYAVWFYPTTGQGYLHQVVTTVASKVYRFSVWAKLQTDGYISVIVEDSTSENVLGQRAQVTPPSWTEYSFYITAESTGTRIKLLINGVGRIATFDDVSLKERLLSYKGLYALCATGNKVRKYVGETWSDADTGLAANCTDRARFGEYLYVGLGAANNGRKMTTGTWSEWSTKASYLCAYKGKLCWSWEYKIYHDTTPADPSNATQFAVGSTHSNITGLCIYAGYLHMGKEDGGLWRWDGQTLTELMHLQGRDSDKNFSLMCEHEGFLFYNIGRDIYQYSPTAIVKITPTLAGSLNAEKYGFGMPVAGQSVGGFLYVAFDDGEAVYPYVLAYDRARGAWHIVYKGVSGATMYGLGHSAFESRLWINDGTSRYQNLTPDSDRIYGNYAESGEFITSWFKGSFPFQPKCYADITIKARDCTGLTGERVAVYYELDRSGSWTLLGTVIADGLTKFRLDTAYGGKEAKEIRLKFELARTTGDENSDKTPIVESFHVAFMDRPEAVYMYRVTVKLVEDLALRDGSAETYTVAELKTHLEECYESVVPIIYRQRIDAAPWVFLRTFSALEPKLFTDGRREMRYDIQMIDAVTSGMEQE